MLYWNKDPKIPDSFLGFHRLFLKKDLQRREQDQRMMLYTDLGIGEHPSPKKLRAGLLESMILLKNGSKDILKFFALLGIIFF